MREILYIQAGTLANYTGTHFWNTQEAYFTYDGSEEPLTLHDRSFQETLISKEPTLCPRLLIFDRKSNFGTLSRSNALFGDGNHESTAGQSLWNGDVVEHRQESIKRSVYQDYMDSELTRNDNDPVEAEDGRDDEVSGDFEVRYWSDFNRVYLNPRSVQILPDTGGWGDVEGDWKHGEEEFARYNEETGLVEDAFRSLLEECDNFQGIHVMHDTATFGSFVHTFLTTIHDELGKVSCLDFPFLSDAIPGSIDFDDVRGVRKAINDAACLRGLNELCSITIPLQSPSTWSTKSLGIGDVDLLSPYQSSAILSAHVETSTLPLRLNRSEDDIASFSAQLDVCGCTRFGQLSGAFPTTSNPEFGKDIFQFSGQSSMDAHQFARRDVSRGFSQPTILAYDEWCAGSSMGPFFTSMHLPPYPLPTSFPSFPSPSILNRPRPRPGIPAPRPSVPMFSRIATTNDTATLLGTYAGFLSDCTRRGSNVATGVGLDTDELKELGNELWTLHDNVSGGGDGEDGGSDGGDMYGEDEE